MTIEQDLTMADGVALPPHSGPTRREMRERRMKRRSMAIRRVIPATRLTDRMIAKQNKARS